MLMLLGVHPTRGLQLEYRDDGYFQAT